jgi:asparagine synthase (glutamine-hydrolysing)
LCGIVGAIGLHAQVADAVVERMANEVRHRGPDDRGKVTLRDDEGNTVVLAHTRLSIIDLSPAGHQPMGIFGGPHARAITFNGEIFNFAQLRAELEAAGSRFEGGSDTEVLLEAVRAWGCNRALERMRGMFAWALADKAKGSVWLCRDRLGVKPLYWTRPIGGGLLFASELRALLAAGGSLVRRAISPVALESFFAQGMVCGDHSLVEGIHLLGAGESLELDWKGKERSRHRYWRLSFPTRAPDISREEAVAGLGERLREAVKLRLVSDVPLGLFLSGGVDSASLAALATEVNPNLRTLAVGFDVASFDETLAAERLARHFRTDHRTVRLTGPELLADIEDVFRTMDQPTVDGFNTYVVSRAARRGGLTVALSGLGGDELFGGYASFRDVPRSVWLGQRLRRARPLLAPAAHFAGQLRTRGAAKLSEALRRPSRITDMYFLRRELFLPADRRELMPRPEGSEASTGVPKEYFEELEEAVAGLDPENAISHLELRSYMQHMLLRDADVFSMANGLELRVPLLDHRLVEYATSLPGKWKRPMAKPKALLVDAVGPRLPDEVWRRPKRGFAFPWAVWLRGPMRTAAEAILRDRDLWRRVGLEEDAPGRLSQRFFQGDRRVSPLQVLSLWALGWYVRQHELTSAT